jgi:DNA polymerase III alpha subunit
MLCLISHQTAYLKANYPAEYMAVLSNDMSDITKFALYGRM